MTTSGLHMPTTDTPPAVIASLVSIVGLGGAFLYWAFGDWGYPWGVMLWCVILAFATSAYTASVPSFHALILLNEFTGRQRTVFQGTNLKLPWEQRAATYVDLRVDLHEVCKATYPSLDALMEATYVYTMRPDLSGDAGAQVILYSSYNSDAVQRSGKALIGMLLSDYFGKKRGEDLLEKRSISEDVFGRDPGAKMIAEFQGKHAVTLSVQLENSGFDAATQKFRSMVSGAKSFTEAVQQLVAGGISRPEAEKVAKMMNLVGVKEYFVNFRT